MAVDILTLPAGKQEILLIRSIPLTPVRL